MGRRLPVPQLSPFFCADGLEERVGQEPAYRVVEDGRYPGIT